MAEKEQEGPREESQGSRLAATLKRSAKIAALIIAVVVGGITVTVVVTGGEADLPFEYEGFD